MYFAGSDLLQSAFPSVMEFLSYQIHLLYKLKLHTTLPTIPHTPLEKITLNALKNISSIKTETMLSRPLRKRHTKRRRKSTTTKKKRYPGSRRLAGLPSLFWGITPCFVILFSVCIQLSRENSLARHGTGPGEGSEGGRAASWLRTARV